MLNSAPAANNRIEQVMRVLDRKVQLPAERADEVHAQQIDVGGEPHFRHLSREPGKGRIVQGRIHQFRQDIPGTRSGDDEAAAAGGDVAQGNAAVRGQHLLQIVAVVALGGAGAHHVEMLLGDLGDGELRANAAAAGEGMAQRHAPDLGRHLVGDQAIEPGFRARTRHFVFGEGA